MLNDLTTRMNRRAGLAAMLALLGVGIEEVDATKQAKRRRRRKRKGGDNQLGGKANCRYVRPGANLSGCNLTLANLSGKDLYAVNLTDANLTYATLTDANLTYANLTGANLTGAILAGAILRDTLFCRTTMPDGTINNSGCPQG